MITEILKAIDDRLKASGIVTAVLVAPAGTPYTFEGVRFLFAHNLSKTHQPPRVVWVLVSDEHLKGRSRRPPRQVPGHPVPLLSRELVRTQHNVVAHLWADGNPSNVSHEQALHVLKSQVIEESFAVCGWGEGACRVGDGEHIDQQGSQLDLGEAYLLKMQFFTPVYAARGNVSQVRPVAISQDTGMIFLNGDEEAGVPAP